MATGISVNPVGAIRQIAKSSSAGQLLGEQLLRRVGQAYGVKNPTQVTHEQLFEAFTLSGFEFVGQAAHGYAAVGVGGGVDFGVDIGKAVLPGFATAGASFSAQGSVSSETLVAVLRQPVPTASRTRPICYFTGKGRLWQGAAKLSAAVGVSAQVNVNATGQSGTMMSSASEKKRQNDDARAKFGAAGTLGLEQLSVEASAAAGVDANASYSGEFMLLRDPSPTWYQKVNDPELRELFSSFVGYGTKTGIKDRIRTFFYETEAGALRPLFHDLSFWQILQKAITQGGIPFDQLLASLRDAKAVLDAIQWLDSQGSRGKTLSQLQGLQQRLQDELQSNWLSRRLNKDSKHALKNEALAFFKQDPGLSLFLPEPGHSGQPSLAAWTDAINKAAAAVALDPAKRAQLLDEVRYHNKVVAYFREGPAAIGASTVAAPNTPSRLSYLNLWGHAAKAGAGAKASLAAAVTPAASLAASAGVRVSTEKKWTIYRFQHYGDVKCAEGTMPYQVYTQDSVVTYAQTAVAGEATAQVSLAGMDVIEKATGKKAEVHGNTFLVNTLSYETAQATWQPAPQQYTVPLLKGSGLSIAHSVTLGSVRKIILGDSSAAALLDVLAKQLCVAVEDLEATFEAASWLLDADLPTPALLVEASFDVGTGKEFGVTWEDGVEPKLDKDFKTILAAHAAPLIAADRALERDKKRHLQAIRLRYRIADTLDSSTTFKLGLPVGIFKVGIELSAVAKAGSSGIVDLATEWFGANAPGTESRGSIAYPEDSVPAVTLFHQ